MADQVNYKVVEGWEQLPKGFAHRDVAGVAVDQEDRVFLICRGENPVIVYDREGNFLRTWGKGDFSLRTHGIYVAPNGSIFATDDGNHTVRQFTPEGRLLMTMGTLNVPSDTGYDGKTTGSIKQAGPPFNRPTNVAIGPKGDIYISDGYGNARVHMFSPSGQLKRSWGEPGDGPGQFRLPHGIAVSRRRAGVCVRPRNRPNPDLQPGRRIPGTMDRYTTPDAPYLRCEGQCICDRACLARRRQLLQLRPRHSRCAMPVSAFSIRRASCWRAGAHPTAPHPAASPRRTGWRWIPRTIST